MKGSKIVIIAIAAAVLALIVMAATSSKAEAHVVTANQCGWAHSIDRADVRRDRTLTCILRAGDHKLAHCGQLATPEGRAKCVIMIVFGRYGNAAVSVARCESTLRTTAENGQYKGLFQMGSNERSTYGHGPSARVQSLAAYRYFVASGRDWSPWECKP